MVCQNVKILTLRICVLLSLKLGFTSNKALQPLQGMELQEIKLQHTEIKGYMIKAYRESV